MNSATVMDCGAGHIRYARGVGDRLQLLPGFGEMGDTSMRSRVGGWWGIVGLGVIAIPICATVGASEKPVTGDRIIRETQEAMKATKDYTIQQKDAFQRKIQTELDDMQVHITQLRAQLKHESGKTRADMQKAIEELEKKTDLANKKL